MRHLQSPEQVDDLNEALTRSLRILRHRREFPRAATGIRHVKRC